MECAFKAKPEPNLLCPYLLRFKEEFNPQYGLKEAIKGLISECIHYILYITFLY